LVEVALVVGEHATDRATEAILETLPLPP